MKPIVKGVLTNLACMVIFAIIYIILKNHFKQNNDIVENMDCLLFSASIQSGCGFTHLNPSTNLSKLIVFVQIIILISINIVPIFIYLM